MATSNIANMTVDDLKISLRKRSQKLWINGCFGHWGILRSPKKRLPPMRNQTPDPGKKSSAI